MELVSDLIRVIMVSEIEQFDVLLKNAENSFRTQFGREPKIRAVAPGRVNIIGEHTDYNDGYVLPMVSVEKDVTYSLYIHILERLNIFRQALPMVTIIVGSRNDTDSQVNLLTLAEGIKETQNLVHFDTKTLAPGQLPKSVRFHINILRPMCSTSSNLRHILQVVKLCERGDQILSDCRRSGL